MNDNELGNAWTTLEPTVRQRRRIEAQLFSDLEAHDSPLAAEWLGMFSAAPFATIGFVAVSAAAIVVTPLLWFARVFL
jgi:hypothetical protein